MAATAKPPVQKPDRIDTMVEDSFPASDPPAYSGGFSLGGPPHSSELKTKSKRTRAEPAS